MIEQINVNAINYENYSKIMRNKTLWTEKFSVYF